MEATRAELLRIVRAEPGISAADLAQELGVGDRTVRTYVRGVNEALGAAGRVEHRRGQGYFLVVGDAAALAAIVRGERPAGALPETPEERVDWLSGNLLLRGTWVTVDDLASTLYVSRASVSGTLKIVESTLCAYGLALERRPRYGIRVTGLEAARRLCLVNLLTEEGPTSSELRDDLSRVARRVDETCRKKGFSVSSAAYRNLVTHVTVAVRRLGEGGFVSMADDSVESLRPMDAWPVACALADALSDEFCLEFPESEIAYLALQLAGRQVLGEVPGSGLVISDETWAVVGEMLGVVEGFCGVDFQGDLELRMNLARHVGPLAIRLRHHMRVENPLLPEIEERYPAEFSMVREAAAVLAKTYGEFPPDEEIGYVALPFILAMERAASRPAKKDVLVVCASGQGSAKLLEWRYRRDFGPWLGRMETCDIAHLDDARPEDFDYVFTTVPLGRTLSVPVREVRFFMDDMDVAVLRRLLSDADGVPEVAACFSPRLFLAHLECTSRSEVLDALCAQVCVECPVHGDLRGLVEERERLARTSFGNLVAMPHPSRPVVDVTCVCVGVLNVPVDWGGHPVQVVFLVCIARGHAGALDGFYRTMARLMGSERQMRRLAEKQDYQTLLALLAESENKKGRPER